MKLRWFGLSLFMAMSVVSAPAHSEWVIDTQQVTFSTQQNQPLRKSVRLTMTEATEQPLQVTPSDLELADGSDRIPAQAIIVTAPNTPLAASQTQAIEIQLQGNAIKTSGEFTGSLLIQANGNSQVLPITVQVKSPPGFPLFTLFIGAGLGTMLSLYRAVGQPKDELLVRVGKLRTQMQGETEAAAARFKSSVEGQLVAVETALSNRDWATAETHVKTAQTIWTRWLSGKPDWIVQIAYLEDLLAQATEANAYQQAMTTRLKTIQRQVAERESPQALADQVSAVREQLEQYKRGDGWLTKLSDLSAKLDDSAEKARWNRKREILQDELDALTPDKTDAFNAWLVKAKEAYKELSGVFNPVKRGSLTEAERGLVFTPDIFSLQPMPAVSEQGKRPSPQYDPQNAQLNLRVFRWGSQLAAIALISWLGMAEVYEREATFGAQPISDYFGLFAWGFGAEVSRDAIVKTLGDVKSSLSQKKKEDS